MTPAMELDLSLREQLPEAGTQERLRELLGITDPRVFVWPRYVPYFYCGYLKWPQHSAYLRQLEEVVDRFLAYIGLPIGGVLRTRRWIPVVQEHVLEIFHQVQMEETLFTTFAVTEMMAQRLFKAQVAFYVLRSGRRVLAASGQITHGYVEVRDPQWESRLVRLDDATAALLEQWMVADAGLDVAAEGSSDGVPVQ